MGDYVNVTPQGDDLPAIGKIAVLIETADATLLPGDPIEWVPNLVCVVENANFEAAAWADTEERMNYFIQHANGRPTAWLIVPNVQTLIR